MLQFAEYFVLKKTDNSTSPHYIFIIPFIFISVYIESHSALKSFEILEESVNIMIGKCDTLLAEIDKHTDTEAEK